MLNHRQWKYRILCPEILKAELTIQRNIGDIAAAGCAAMRMFERYFMGLLMARYGPIFLKAAVAAGMCPDG
jgi:hypothetical protein